MKKEVIVLTKSVKYGGYCLAGIDARTGDWIRILSNNKKTKGAVPPERICYPNGTEISVYDIISVDFAKHVPTRVQPENWLYDESAIWEKTGQSNLKEVLKLHDYDNPDCIFGNTDYRLQQNWAFSGEPSLLLLKVHKPIITVKTFEQGADPQITMSFVYRHKYYKFIRITQKSLKEAFGSKEDADYPLLPNIMVFSLADQYARDGYYYKLVAQILE
ncbi:MAG: hypothetical protein LBQ97_07715 [Fusobacteriaceae bacterium]|jgi:hypothetical protein|nr:hypothetical protein [Fusobacteriaceae bacterium]